MKVRIILSSALVLMSLSGSSFARNADSAARLVQVSRQASTLIGRILANGGAQPGVQPGVQPGASGGSSGGGGIDLPWIVENDAIALPIFMQASGQFNIAGNYAFESQLAYLNGQFAVGNFKFTAACARLSASKNVLARANLAAIQPPVGLFGAFNGEVLNMLNVIEQTRLGSGCL